jgi:hypothetical protein
MTTKLHTELLQGRPNLSVIQEYLQKDANPNQPYQNERSAFNGFYPLHIAVFAHSENHRLVDLLCFFEANPNCLTPRNKTPLDLLAEILDVDYHQVGPLNAHKKVITCLLRYGCDPHNKPTNSEVNCIHFYPFIGELWAQLHPESHNPLFQPSS